MPLRILSGTVKSRPYAGRNWQGDHSLNISCCTDFLTNYAIDWPFTIPVITPRLFRGRRVLPYLVIRHEKYGNVGVRPNDCQRNTKPGLKALELKDSAKPNVYEGST
jgi:hypothetical protein